MFPFEDRNKSIDTHENQHANDLMEVQADEKKKWSVEGLREKRDWLKKQMTFPLEKRVSEHLTDEV